MRTPSDRQRSHHPANEKNRHRSHHPANEKRDGGQGGDGGLDAEEGLAFGGVKRALIVVGVLVVLGGLGLGAAWMWVQERVYTPLDPAADAVIFEVPSGANARAVGEKLADAGIIRDALAWQVWLRLESDAPTLKAGRHEVSASMTLPEVHAALAAAPLPEDEPFTVVEGWRRADTDAALAAQGWAEPGAYLAATEEATAYDLPFEVAAPSLEGYLFPETYKFVKDDFVVKDLVQRQLDTFVERFWKLHADDVEASKRSLHDLVTMASMLEREEPVPSVRPKVAGVLYKRLDSDHPLGVDATSRYTLEAWNDRPAFLKKLRDPDDPYNTRLRTGLPPTPIGAPSVPSLRAALEPEPSPYWYYLHDADQQIHFAETAEGHEANRRRYNVW